VRAESRVHGSYGAAGTKQKKKERKKEENQFESFQHSRVIALGEKKIESSYAGMNNRELLYYYSK